MKSASKAASVLASFCILGFLALPAPALAEGWEWGVTPYLWASSTGLDVEVNDRQLLDGEVSFDDLLDNLKMAASVHVEGQNGAFGLLFDAYYVDLGNERTVASLPNLGAVNLEADFKTTIFEGAGVWAPGGTFEGFGLIFGARVWNLQQTLDLGVGGINLAHYSVSPTLLDGMIGFRYLAPIGERGSFNVRADYAAGGTESTLNGVLGFGFSFGSENKYTALLGYRYMAAEFKESDSRAEVESELTLAGLYAGLRIGF